MLWNCSLINILRREITYVKLLRNKKTYVKVLRKRNTYVKVSVEYKNYRISNPYKCYVQQKGIQLENYVSLKMQCHVRTA